MRDAVPETSCCEKSSFFFIFQTDFYQLNFLLLLPRVNTDEDITASLAGIFFENPVHHGIYLLFNYPVYFGLMNRFSLSFDFLC